jgi:high-affinity Fe2+/Pb2+ permease
MLNELFPIVSGVLLGLFIQTLRPSLRLWIAVPVATVLGVLATIVSGEFKIGWEFLLIDIPLVAAAAWATIMAARLIRQRLARDDQQRPG